MKATWNAVAILLLLHLLAAIGFVAWLVQDGRLDRERLVRVKQMFATTIEQEREADEREATAQASAQTQQARDAWLASVRSGPMDFESHLAADQAQSDLAEHHRQRFEQDRRAWLEQMARLQERVETLQAQLSREREQFAQQKQREADQADSDGFKKALDLYERSKPRQVKQMFMDLIDQGKLDQVVTFIEAMQPRKATALLKQFKTPEEIGIATQIMQIIRARAPQAVEGEAAAAAGGPAS